MWKFMMGASALALAAACVNTSDIVTDPVVVDAPPAVEDTVVAEVDAVMEKVAFETYSADAFFQTTSFGLANGSGYAWSSDDSKILAHSDVSGVFNAIAISADGAVSELTSSETDAHFVQSFFPSDDRIIVSADQGGNELNHIYVVELDGTLVDVTPGDEVKAFFGGWRGDNEVFYVWHNGRDSASFDLYSVSPT
ncbi:MAG: S9 family peptidase, partial [Pseudomonadota bacterium]